MMRRRKGKGGGVGAGMSPSPRQHGAAPHGTEKEAVQRHPAARGTGRVLKEGLPPPDRLLIVFTGGMGDLVMALPLLSRAVSQVREVWLCALDGFTKWLDLVNLPGLKIVSESRVRGGDAPFFFDAAIMTHSTPGGPPLPPSALPARLGVAGRNYPFPCHATEANLEAGLVVGLREDFRREYPLQSGPIPNDLQGDYAVVCPGNSAQGVWRKKLLPHNTWPGVVKLLRRDGLKAAGLDLHPPVAKLDLDRSWWGELGPLGIAAVLKGARVVVTVDCGVAHLAAALGTPTVAAWGPTSRTWSRPIGPSVSIMSKTGCRQCLGTPLWDECREPSCMGIPAEAIVAGAREAVTLRGLTAHA